MMLFLSSVSDPYHFDADPDPRIRIRDDGSGSWLIRIRMPCEHLPLSNPKVKNVVITII